MKREHILNLVFSLGKSVVLVFLGLCFALVFGACDRSDFEPSAHQTSADLELLEDGSASALRAMETTSPDWKEGSYDGIVAMKYKIATPVNFASNYYRFQVVSLDPMTSEIWIKYYSPQGNIVYERMERNGSTFEVDRKLQQEGNYSYAFFIKKVGGIYPRISSPGLSVKVILPVPPVGDDYPWPNELSETAQDPWGFYKRWCTSWVAFKVNQMWRTEKDFRNGMGGVRLGAAYEWKGGLVRLGYSADLEPKAGDIAWWASNHVAFVNRVVDRNTVEITEYNNPPAGKRLLYHRRYLYRSSSFPDAFIHVQQKK